MEEGFDSLFGLYSHCSARSSACSHFRKCIQDSVKLMFILVVEQETVKKCSFNCIIHTLESSVLYFNLSHILIL